VLRCFEAGALATGATLEVHDTNAPYAEVHHDSEIAALYRRNAESLGRVFPDLGRTFERAAGSTDMGNISLAIPSIHPYIGINSLPAVNHQPEFAAHLARLDELGYGGESAGVTRPDLPPRESLARLRPEG